MNTSVQTRTETSASDVATPAIEAREVSFAYGERLALDGLTLAVPAGSIFGLLGPNGSGKSTLLSLLIGQRQPLRGGLRILGKQLTPGLRQRIGVVFQGPSLDPQMTVGETMGLQARLFGLPRSIGEARSEELLRRVNLLDRVDAFTTTLSGGMRRRLELARALLTSPEVLLLDEPTLALDPESKQALWQYLVEANASGVTLLLATNDVYEAERYCGTVALIDEGRLVAEGAPAELKRDLRHDAVRIEWKSDPSGEVAAMQLWPGVGHVRLASHTTHVTVDDASAFLARAFQHAGDRIHSVRIEESTLEDVYFQLVGKGIASAEREDAS